MVGGRNGYGAKLANVFSTEFKVETCDGKNRRHLGLSESVSVARPSLQFVSPWRARFSQLYKNNMQACGYCG